MQRQTTSQREVAPSTAAYVSLVSVGSFAFFLLGLHFLEPDFNPPHSISEYQLGRIGWLMSLAFFCLGVGSSSCREPCGPICERPGDASVATGSY